MRMIHHSPRLVGLLLLAVLFTTSMAFLPPYLPQRRTTSLVVSAEGASRKDAVLSGLLAAGAALGALNPLPVFARPEGVNRPDLLPAEQTNVIDIAKYLTSGQRKRMDAQLARLEKDTGYKVRVLCQRYPETPGLAVVDYWKVDPKTVVMVADKFQARNPTIQTRNLLHFNVGQDLMPKFPQGFWNRVEGAFGSIFFLRNNSEDQSVISAVNAIDYCLRQRDGCTEVPKDMIGADGVFNF